MSNVTGKQWGQVWGPCFQNRIWSAKDYSTVV